MSLVRQFFIPWGMDGFDAAPGATTHLMPFVSHVANAALDRGPYMPLDCRLVQVQMFGGFGLPSSDGQLPTATPPAACAAAPPPGGLASGFVSPIANEYQVWKNVNGVVTVVASLLVTKAFEGNTERCHIGSAAETNTEKPDQRMYGRLDCNVSFAKGDRVAVVVVSPNSPYWVTEPSFVTVNTLWQVTL